MVRGLRGAVSRFAAADGLFLSAGLAFFFMVSLIPVVLIGVSMLGFVLSTRAAEEAVIGQLARNFPVYSREIARALRRIVETRGVSGAVGSVVLVFFAMPLFGAARLVMHRVLGVRMRTGLVRRLLVDAALVVVVGVLLFVATMVTWGYQWALTAVRPPAGLPPSLGRASGLALSVGTSATTFYLAYRYLPQHRVRAGAAAAGALMGAGLWEVAKQLFRLYIQTAGMYDQIYGPLGVLVAFVMFVYYSAVVFVFGAAYAAALNTGGRR